MIFRTALTFLLAAVPASGFFVAPQGVNRRPFGSLQVSLSEPSANTELSQDSSESLEIPAEPSELVEEASTEAVAEGAESASEVAPSAEQPEKSPKNTERHTIYVGNLPFSSSVQEVRDLFAEHVDVRYVNLPKNQETGKIKGFAFVDVGTDEEVPKAVSALDGIELEGRPLRISRSLPKSKIRSTKKTFDGSKKLYIGNIPFTSTDDDLREYFSEFGEVTDIFLPVNKYGEPRGFAFISVKEEDADGVIEATDGMEFMGRTLVVNLPLPPGEKAARGPRPQRMKLYVGNLSFYTTGETLTDVFQEFGSVYDCYIPFDVNNGNSRGFGFITMDKEAAESAVDSLDGIELDGRIISVNEARARGPPKENNSWEDEDEDESP